MRAYSPSVIGYVAAAFLSVSLFLLGPVHEAVAAQGDCGQPFSSGTKPAASDCNGCLQVAVGTRQVDPPCLCDLNGSGSVTASDALICLQIAVGLPGLPLDCPCAKCTSMRIMTAVGSDLDTGWKGPGHNADLAIGSSITMRVVKHCKDAPATICTLDAQCPGSRCEPTCDCDDPGSGSCDIAGPTQSRRCLISLDPCDTNADCAAGQSCEYFFGPPLPLSAEGTPACVTNYLDRSPGFTGNDSEPFLTGTTDFATGETVVSGYLRARVHLGISLDKPCPRCGDVPQQPAIGDTFTCSGGPNNGQACTVDAITPDFGGVSNDCPPDVAANVSGAGIAIPISELSTGTVMKTAVLPCQPPLDFHPDNGNAFCLGNPSVGCTANADCAEGEGPCGLYCHCGYCDGDADLPCFDDSDCPESTTCQVGTPNMADEPQQSPNLCSSLVCGAGGPELCDAQTAPVGECSLESYRSCSSNSDCQSIGAGICILSPRPCFENKITREGVPSPLGSYCIDDPDVGACTSNADCNVGACVDDTAEPTSVALFCVPKTSSSGINSASGIPGPGAVSLKTVVEVCRCGDGVIGCDEECDRDNDAACPGACDLENCLCGAASAVTTPCSLESQ
jgi:hypothetical protein